MEFVPVQLEVHCPELHLGAKILLQVWNRKGDKVFQKRLQAAVTQWAICFHFFIFKTNAPDDDSDYFQILNLKTQKVTFVQDFLKDSSFVYFAYNNGKFFAANSECIKITAVKPSNFKAMREINPKNVATIQLWDSLLQTGSKIHGLAVTSEGLYNEKT